MGLIEPHFWAVIFNFHGNFCQEVGNYHWTTSKLPWENPFYGILHPTFDLYSSNSFFLFITGSEVTCHSKLCHNGGRCEQQWNSYICNCDMTSFTGQQCAQGKLRGLLTLSSIYTPLWHGRTPLLRSISTGTSMSSDHDRHCSLFYLLGYFWTKTKQCRSW
jgi:hypothetical protein